MFMITIQEAKAVELWQFCAFFSALSPHPWQWIENQNISCLPTKDI